MYKGVISILLWLLFSTHSHAYETENKVQAAIIGKLAKFIQWEKKSDYFIITVLKNPFNDILNTLYHAKKIKNHPIKINYIDDIQELSLDTNILYIPQLNQSLIDQVIRKARHNNILTISDSRGFTDKGGMIQLHFVSQKIKIKINNTLAKAERLKINPSLLRISTVVNRQKSHNED